MKVIEVKEKVLSREGNEEIIERVTICEKEDGNQYKQTTKIKKITEKKKMNKDIAERLKIPKFGECAGQPRGHLEPGIVRMSNDVVRIIDRETNLEQDLKDKLVDDIQKKKNTFMEEMLQQIEKERQQRLNQIVNKPAVVRQQRNNDRSVRITGFNALYNEDDIKEIFEKKGLKVKRVFLVRDKMTGISKNIAFVEFDQTIYVKEAIEKMNDKAYDGCVLIVTPSDQR